MVQSNVVSPQRVQAIVQVHVTKRKFTKYPLIYKTTEREKRKRVVIAGESLPKKLPREYYPA